MGVEFEFSIDLRSNDKQVYLNSIQRLRVKLGVRSSHNLPVLAIQENPPTRFFDLVIQTGKESVRFRLQMDNLYLLGYQMKGGQWLELNNGSKPPKHLITEPGTTFLGFSGDYNALARADGRETVEGIGVGLNSLQTAINDLATSTNRGTRAHSLIVVIMMTCESTRFIPVSTYMHKNFNAQDSRIPGWMLDLVRTWGTFSAVLLRADANPGESFRIPDNDVRIPSEYGPTKILTQADLIVILGILLGLCFRPDDLTRFPRMIVDEGSCLMGLTLMEVFSVHIEATNLGQQIYGTTTINDGLTTQYIFNRTSNNPETIKPTHNVLLTGPSRAISAFGNIIIKLLLTDKPRDTEIINDGFSWDAFEIGNEYDKLVSQTLNSSRGSVTVNYAVLRNAVAARVTLTLEEGGKTTSNIYGQVSAHYDKWEDPKTKCLLFDRASNDSVAVRQRENIPLLRSVLAVPLSNPLKITASLSDYDTVSADKKIANGTVEFPVPNKVPGTSSKEISGEGGNKVTVKVNWTFDF